MNNYALKLIRLKDGDMIACHTSITNYKDLYRTHSIEIKNPLSIVAYQVPTDTGVGEGFILKPWMGICVDENYIIPTDCIMTVADLKTEIKEQYERYWNPAPPPLEVDLDPEEWEYQSSFLKRNNLLN